MSTGPKETSIQSTRRAFLAASAVSAFLGSTPQSVAHATPGGQGDVSASTSPNVKGLLPVNWVATTERNPWQRQVSNLEIIDPKMSSDYHAFVLPDEKYQVMEGYGACLHELGWLALQALEAHDRERLLDELFTPNVGANFGICRLPIGANDYARNWYSNDEHPGDFLMKKFSIARDRELIVPFIKSAQRRRPNMKFWASPWSPPTWMKTNGHYAQAMPRAGFPENGLAPNQVVHEGEDGFIQKQDYFKAYALYFRRFVEEYSKLGISISMVMPQNEFNSAQNFPSCCWTPQGLSRFIPYLGKEMQSLGVDVYFGTLEREDDKLFEVVYSNPEVTPFVKGVGAQWAGRKAIPFIHHAHPNLKIIQSEQECGDGRNDWRFARYTWTLMKDFLRAGASTYEYWNVATVIGGVSTWGWPQNSLISVDPVKKTYAMNPDYFVLKHLTHFVRPGATRIRTLSFSGYENMLAFRNPDGRIVVVVQNDIGQPMPIHLTVGSYQGPTYRAMLPADSFSTIVI